MREEKAGGLELLPEENTEPEPMSEHEADEPVVRDARSASA